MSAVLKSSGDFMSFFKTGLKVAGLRSGMADNVKLHCQAGEEESGCLYCTTIHQNFMITI
jgi:hypothetical protein